MAINVMIHIVHKWRGNILSIHELKRQWEDELVKEDDEKIKMGLTKKCMNCHKEVEKCGCIGHTLDSTYWGY